MYEFKLPDLGEGIHEGQIVNVLVEAGDAIAEYQPMMEVETDKAAVEIPSPKTGVVAQVHVKAGDMVKVGQVLLTIDESGDGDGKAAARKAEPVTAAAPVAGPAQQAAPPAPAPSRPTESGPVPAAPVVRKLARERGIDINAVTGSGPGGRVLREDVERHAGGEGPAPQRAAGGAPSLVPVPSGELPDFSQYGPIRREPVSQIRKTIARQMTRAWLSVPRVTHCDTADITDLERNRKAFNANLKEDQAKLTMTAIVVNAIAATLRDFQMLNSSFDASAGEIIYKDYIHIGIAIDTPRGLVVPVLRDADKKGLPRIAKELNDIGERARAAKFEIAELRGASFTITNVGAVGGTFVTPMVNFPEVGILGLGRAKLEPVVYGGQIVPRLIMPLSLSFDHRVVDGADAARFTTEVIRSLENPLRLM